MASPEQLHEPDLSSGRPLALVMASTLLLVVAVSAGLWFGFQSARPQPEPAELSPPDMPAQVPRLQRQPEADLRSLMQAQARRLHGVGWVDREAGIIHMPIERAMALMAERGLGEDGL